MSIRARKSQYNEDWHVEQEFPCINGLSAWFVIATAEEADEASLGYTEGVFGSAEERANSIVSALTGHTRSSERCDAGWQPIETAPFVSAKRYMLTSHHRIPFVGFRYYENGPWLDEHGHFQKPTHWRELPDTSCIDVVSGSTEGGNG